jgi:hypothetical protein
MAFDVPAFAATFSSPTRVWRAFLHVAGTL